MSRAATSTEAGQSRVEGLATVTCRSPGPNSSAEQIACHDRAAVPRMTRGRHTRAQYLRAGPNSCDARVPTAEVRRRLATNTPVRHLQQSSAVD